MRRKQLLSLVGFVGVVILISRLLYVHIAQSARYTRLADQNRIRKQRLLPTRGTLYDRTGAILAQGQRLYTNQHAFIHTVGYVGEVNTQEMQQDTCPTRLLPGDTIGKLGAELWFDCRLRGIAGTETHEVLATEETNRVLHKKDPIRGEDIHLTLNARLQEVAYQSLGERRGAVISLKPGTGEILTLLSTPGFTTEDIIAAAQDERKPLLNRATQGLYPPGSVYKMVVAFAGLATGAIKSDEHIVDNGSIKIGDTTFGNWYFLEYGKTDGPVDMIKSIQRSNDIYYYTLGGRVGPEIMRAYALKLGYGQQISSQLQDLPGIIPYPFWKKEQLQSDWYLGDTFNASIGQGYTTVTPLQVARMTQIIANRGKACDLHVEKTKRNEVQICKDTELAKEYFDTIISGMESACKPNGTGWPLFQFPIPIACKTGTAENKENTKTPHAWFTVFAPITEPEISITVLVEEGGQGSDAAAPVAKALLESYFQVTTPASTQSTEILRE